MTRSYWTEISNGFPINKKGIWLNSCGIAAPHRYIIDTLKDFIDEYAANIYCKGLYSYETSLATIKQILGSWIEAQNEEISVLHNTAEGMNIFSHGISLPSGSSILLLENEYPSNVYPWLHWQEKGVQIKYMPYQINSSDFMDMFQKKLTPDVKVVSFSAVHWLTGLRLPLEDIGLLCKKNNTYFVVDGAQGVGHIPINVKKMNISYMTCSAWKWLLGPLGLGFLYIDKDILEKIQVKWVGTRSFPSNQDYLPYKTKFESTADRFLLSTHSLFNWLYFATSLSWLDKIGIEKVQKRIFQLSQFTKQQLNLISYHTLDNNEHSSGIVILIPKKQQNVTALHEYLLENKITCSVRDNTLRISLHLMNNEEQISKMVKYIDRY